NISRPRSISTFLPSMTVKLHGRKRLPILIGAVCTRPMILANPTPLAMPPYRLSTRRMIPHASAMSGLIIVACAPESTRALTFAPFTSTSKYNMCT
ncbi:hypothetical protein B0T20DRAFT_320802, partial [Sordaria brevicollis]